MEADVFGLIYYYFGFIEISCR